MTSPIKKDLIADGLNQMISFWSDKPIAQGIIKTKLQEIQKLEDLAFQLLTERSVTTAVGEQLNVIGYLVGEERQGRQDEPFREAILLRISLNRSDGTPPVILDILNSITESPIPNIYEHFPASFHAYVDRNVSHNLVRVLEQSSASGVEARLVFDDEGDSFVGAVAVDSEALFFDEFLFEVGTGEYFTLEDVEFIGDDKSYLQAEEDISIYNPFASVLDSTSYYNEVGLFDTGDNYIFELEDGSLFEYRILEEIT